MTPDQRNQIAMARIGNYYDIMRTTIFTLTAVAAVIHLGPGGYSAPLTVLVIATCAFGILAGGAALSDAIALRDDMDEATAASHYGRGTKARNLPMLKSVSAGLLALIGVAELYTIFV